MIWQEAENHYCMIGDNGFPVIPLDLDPVSKLQISIDLSRGGADTVFDLLGDLPLTVTWDNQWYTAKGNSRQCGDYLQMFFNPAWDKNAFLLSYRQEQFDPISPEQTFSLTEKVNHTRRVLVKRMAAA